MHKSAGESFYSNDNRLLDDSSGARLRCGDTLGVIESAAQEWIEHFEAATTTRVAALESAAACFDVWQPYIEASIGDIKGIVDSVRSEVSKLASGQECEGRHQSFGQPSILGEHGSASTRPSAGATADGPHGHRWILIVRRLDLGVFTPEIISHTMDEVAPPWPKKEYRKQDYAAKPAFKSAHILPPPPATI